MPSQIRVSSGVIALNGPLIEDTGPRKAITTDNGRNIKRYHKSHEQYIGIVLASVSEQHWKVYWDQTGQISIHPTVKLRYEGERSIPSNVLESLNNNSNNGTTTNRPASAVAGATNPNQNDGSDLKCSAEEHCSSGQEITATGQAAYLNRGNRPEECHSPPTTKTVALGVQVNQNATANQNLLTNQNWNQNQNQNTVAN